MDIAQPLSAKEVALIGALTGELVSTWDSWIHRRVDHITFSDEDTIHREISIDFTLPDWLHTYRETPHNRPALQLVPLGLMRKGVLVNFSLRAEDGSSLPLLTASQNARVAGAILRSVAQNRVPGLLPGAITYDIQRLVRDRPARAREVYERLLFPEDEIWEIRKALREYAPFRNLAMVLRDNFLALTVAPVGANDRRVVRLSYEKRLGDLVLGRDRLRPIRRAFGEPRDITIPIPAASEAESYHLEVEAPDGLMITRREGHFINRAGKVESRPAPGGYRRAHFHFDAVARGGFANAVIRLRPRESTVIRAAALMALLALIATAGVAARYPHIEDTQNEAAAAVLLAFAGVIGLIVVRSGENEIATFLLFPLRVLATIPVALAVIAAVVVVINPADVVAYALLGTICVLMGVGLVGLMRNWRLVRGALRQYQEKAERERDEASFV